MELSNRSPKAGPCSASSPRLGSLGGPCTSPAATFCWHAPTESSNRATARMRNSAPSASRRACVWARRPPPNPFCSRCWAPCRISRLHATPWTTCRSSWCVAAGVSIQAPAVRLTDRQAEPCLARNRIWENLMSVFGKSWSEYLGFAKPFIGLILVVGIARLAFSLGATSVPKWIGLSDAKTWFYFGAHLLLGTTVGPLIGWLLGGVIL